MCSSLSLPVEKKKSIIAPQKKIVRTQRATSVIQRPRMRVIASTG